MSWCALAQAAGVLALGVAGCESGTDPAAVASVVVALGTAQLVSIGDTVRFFATARNADGVELPGKTFTWASSATSVATVDGAGLVTAASNGSATITATVDGTAGSGSVSVAQEAVTVAASPELDTLAALGEAVQLTVVAHDARGHEVAAAAVAWNALTAGVITLDPAGLATATANGVTLVVAQVDAAADTLEIVVRQRPAILAYLQQPTQTLAGVPVAPAIAVAVRDSLNHLIADNTDPVTVAIAANPGGATLTGTTTAAAVDGVATFDDREIDEGAAGYTLAASAPGLDGATSDAFDVLLRFISLSAGHVHTCGVATTGKAYCWGDGSSGRLGTGSPESEPVPALVSGGLTFSVVDAGGAGGCGLTTAGTAYCWGGGSDTPAAVSGGHTFTSLSTEHTACALTAAGAAYCWGTGTSGELGNGMNGSSVDPVAVEGGHTFAQIAVGGAHVCARTTDGVGYCWGNNPDGQLGDGGDNTPKNVPTAVSGGRTFAWITAGGDHSCGVTTDGDVYCWGAGAGGQLGDGLATASDVPVAVPGAGSSFTVSANGFEDAGGAHTCAVSQDQDVRCWGQAALGAGSTTSSDTPVSVDGGGVIFNVVTAGGFHTCAIADSGAGYCWGGQTAGQLGDGGVFSSDVPVAVAAPNP